MFHTLGTKNAHVKFITPSLRNSLFTLLQYCAKVTRFRKVVIKTGRTFIFLLLTAVGFLGCSAISREDFFYVVNPELDWVIIPSDEEGALPPSIEFQESDIKIGITSKIRIWTSSKLHIAQEVTLGPPLLPILPWHGLFDPRSGIDDGMFKIVLPMRSAGKEVLIDFSEMRVLIPGKDTLKPIKLMRRQMGPEITLESLVVELSTEYKSYVVQFPITYEELFESVHELTIVFPPIKKNDTTFTPTPLKYLKDMRYRYHPLLAG